MLIHNRGQKLLYHTSTKGKGGDIMAKRVKTIKIRASVRPCPNGLIVRKSVSNGRTQKTVTRHIHG